MKSIIYESARMGSLFKAVPRPQSAPLRLSERGSERPRPGHGAPRAGRKPIPGERTPGPRPRPSPPARVLIVAEEAPESKRVTYLLPQLAPIDTVGGGGPRGPCLWTSSAERPLGANRRHRCSIFPNASGVHGTERRTIRVYRKTLSSRAEGAALSKHAVQPVC
ncbi:hypothetical protein SKAU_G00338100 [Synaphobranchus kaupii]|uniref:Uncharacterized protein n=1 Tax=Synaphobranchus kaupii TaxID=118154 RepID=A0A9Q1IJ88_SYNKA|nr:hypothetical protein SKAU_G00338100 [Synaphobranchus kaupii]